MAETATKGKMIHCSVCDCDVFFSNIGRHNKTKRHLDKIQTTGDTIPKNEVKHQYKMKGPPSMEELLKKEESDDDTDDDINDEDTIFSIHSEDFLKDMENDVFGIEEKQDEQPNMVKELKELRQKNAVAREQAKLKAFEDKQAKQLYKSKPKEGGKTADTASIDGEETEILGKDRRVLLAKICMHRDLFKSELKNTKFRIKKGASVQDLEQILEEMQTIVSINGMEAFTMDVIMGSVRLVEGVSSMTTQFDITGLADALKENPEFTKLVKLMFIKYSSFIATPPEYRLIFLVLINAVIMTRMNKMKKGVKPPVDVPLPV